MKKIVVIVALIAGMRVQAQTDVELQANIESQAHIMVDAFTNANYDLLLDYTYPKILVVAGGRDILKGMVVSMMDDLRQQGITLDSAKVGVAGPIYKAGDELHAVINQYIYMRIPEGHMVSESALLAVSQDHGTRWYFLDLKQLTPELKASFFPDFNNDLVIPDPKDPVITHDNE